MKLLLLIFMTSLTGTATLEISSSVFSNNGSIPSKYTCEGKDINPPLTIKNVPSEAKSLVLIVDDPDAPKGTFDHWVMYNISPTDKIDEDSAPGTQGKNGTGKNTYKGPCPPTGEHHYHFKVYALDIMLSLANGADKKSVESAMQSHILAQGELIGLYQKTK